MTETTLTGAPSPIFGETAVTSADPVKITSLLCSPGVCCAIEGPMTQN